MNKRILIVGDALVDGQDVGPGAGEDREHVGEHA